jgi:hypothetical protein
MPVLVVAAGSIGAVTAQEQSATINRYYVGCHKAKTAGPDESAYHALISSPTVPWSVLETLSRHRR